MDFLAIEWEENEQFFLLAWQLMSKTFLKVFLFCCLCINIFHKLSKFLINFSLYLAFASLGWVPKCSPTELVLIYKWKKQYGTSKMKCKKLKLIWVSSFQKGDLSDLSLLKDPLTVLRITWSRKFNDVQVQISVVVVRILFHLQGSCTVSESIVVSEVPQALTKNFQRWM